VAKVKTTHGEGSYGDKKYKEKVTEIELSDSKRQFAHRIEANGERSKDSSLFARSYDNGTQKYGDWEKVD
jgi:hypothetical protein